MADPTVGDAIDAAARQYGLNPTVLKGIAHIESSWNPNSNRNRDDTQYKGLFQLGSNEWKQHGSGDIYNAQDNANAAAKLLSSHSQWFQNSYGREPTPGELYMMHLQGRGFISKGTMTNVAGNPYPGMQGPQTPESFQKGWSDTLARRMAMYGGDGGTAVAAAPEQPNVLPGMPQGLMGGAPSSGVLNAPGAPTLTPPGAGSVAVASAAGAPAIGKAPADVTADAEKRLGLAQKTLTGEGEKNSKMMMALAQQLMAGSQAKPVQFAQMASADTGPFRPLPLNLPPGFGGGGRA